VTTNSCARSVSKCWCSTLTRSNTARSLLIGQFWFQYQCCVECRHVLGTTMTRDFLFCSSRKSWCTFDETLCFAIFFPNAVILLFWQLFLQSHTTYEIKYLRERSLLFAEFPCYHLIILVSTALLF
jgi:hypothetical protein